jgi:hypothetical protein
MEELTGYANGAWRRTFSFLHNMVNCSFFSTVSIGVGWKSFSLGIRITACDTVDAGTLVAVLDAI